MGIIDLKSHPFLRTIFGKTLRGYANVCRTIDCQAGCGLHVATSLMPLCSEIQERLQRKNLLMSRLVSMHGFCPDYSQGKSARYRDLPPIPKQKTVSYGYPRKSFKVNSCRCQRKSDLRIYSEFAQNLIATTRELYREDSFLEELDETVYALDATTIDLCLSIFL